jgi:hypothetical protein
MTQIIDPAGGFMTCHEGQVYLTVFACSAGTTHDLEQLETFVKDLLSSEGDLFAFKLQPGVEGSLFSALVEFCDNDMSLRAVARFGGTVIEVRDRRFLFYNFLVKPADF